MKKTRVHIIDDHALFRKGVLGLLSGRKDLEISGESESAEAFLDTALRPGPDVLLLDLSVGDELSLPWIPRILEKYPELRIIALTMHNKPVLMRKAINSGIHGYVVKQSPPETLFQALSFAAVGRRYLDPELSDNIFQCLKDPDSRGKGDYNSLTPREQEIFRLLAEGRGTEQIARQLFISRKTAENHRFRLMQKLELSSSAELLAYAEELGVI